MTIDIDPNGPLAYLLEKPEPKTPDNRLGKDAFLKLLVAQMKYQNPMEPTDSTEFISQTAQFTLVEQMENMSKSNADMLAGQLSATAASLIGKDVQWNVAMGDDADAPGHGRVQGVRITTDGPLLIVDGWEVPLARVTAFGHVPDEEPPADDTTGGTGGTSGTTGDTDGTTSETSETTDTSSTGETAPTEGSDDTTPTDESAETSDPTTGTDTAPAA